MENENNRLPEEQEVLEETVSLEETAPAVETEEDLAPLEETVEAPVEPKKGILLTPGKLVGLIVGIVVLVAVLVGAIIAGMGGFGKNDEVNEPSEGMETVSATTPADTGANDVTHKGTYTVSDEEILKLADTVVATAGAAELTNKELQVYYWMQVQNFFSNYYSYLSYFGLDYNLPLDTQICAAMENGYTWQQYFLELALNNWHSYEALGAKAKEAGLELDEEQLAYLNGLTENLTNTAQSQGYPDAEGLVQFNVGAGADLATYVAYEELFLWSDLYYAQQEKAISLTDEEIEAYFDENADYFAESGITKDGIYVDVRHALIVPEGKNPGDTCTEEELESARVKAQELLDKWLAEDGTEEGFAKLANENSADSDGTDGGLYENVYVDQMVPEFNDWCFDETRQPGDSGLVLTRFGYHIMYFVDSRPMWPSYAEKELLQERTASIVTDARAEYPIEVDYSAIALGLVDVSKWFGE